MVESLVKEEPLGTEFKRLQAFSSAGTTEAFDAQGLITMPLYPNFQAKSRCSDNELIFRMRVPGMHETSQSTVVPVKRSEHIIRECPNTTIDALWSQFCHPPCFLDSHTGQHRLPPSTTTPLVIYNSTIRRHPARTVCFTYKWIGETNASADDSVCLCDREARAFPGRSTERILMKITILFLTLSIFALP